MTPTLHPHTDETDRDGCLSRIKDQAALGWQHDWLGNLQMVWTKEPEAKAIERVARRALTIAEATPCIVTFLTEGAFNKVYTVQVGSSAQHIMRISIPVQPQLKTLSEVATIKYIQQHTNIPVPFLLGFEATDDNDVGFEWMIMSYMPGSQLGEQWHSLSWLKKELIVRKMISYLTQLFKERFSHLGNLYTTANLQQLPSAADDVVSLVSEQPCADAGFCLGTIVERAFFWGNHLKFDVPRGPFENSQDWLRTVLRLYILSADDPVAIVKDAEDTDNSDDSYDEPDSLCTPMAIKVRAQRLIYLIPTIFPVDAPEQFVLHHHDLHENNIFVDGDQELVGIIDWECLPTVPLWAACDIPKFLQTRLNRHLCPDPDKYMKKVLDDGSEDLNSLYYEHLVEYEKTQLRTLFLEEMQRVCPAWFEIYKYNKLKVAFGDIVADFADNSNAEIIDEWLDAVEAHGSAPGIGEMLNAHEQELLYHTAHADTLKKGKNKKTAWPEE